MHAGASLHLPQSFTYNKNNNNKNKRQHLPRLPGLHPHNEQQLPHATGRRAKGAKSEETQPDEARHLRDGQSLRLCCCCCCCVAICGCREVQCGAERQMQQWISVWPGDNIASPRSASHRITLNCFCDDLEKRSSVRFEIYLNAANVTKFMMAEGITNWLAQLGQLIKSLASLSSSVYSKFMLFYLA